MTDQNLGLNADDYTVLPAEWEELVQGLQAWEDYWSLMQCAAGEWMAGDPFGYGDQMALDAMGCLDDYYRLMRVPLVIQDDETWKGLTDGA